MKDNKKYGRKAEALAARYLKQQGMGIIAQNYRCKQGEIDLIGWEGDVLVFVEVKAREDDSCGYPGEALTSWKKRRICQTARIYCCKEQVPAYMSIRFDVVEILGNRIRHTKNAFEYQL